MASLARVSQKGMVEIPRPICSRLGDVFEHIIFDDDVPSGCAQGAYAVVVISPRRPSATYAIDTEDGPTLCNLIFCDNGLHVCVHSFHESFPSGNYNVRDLDIIGRVIEFYPTGDPTFRWLFHEEGVEFNPPFDLPLLVPAFKK